MDMRARLSEKISEMMEDPSILCADDVAWIAIAALPDMVQLEWVKDADGNVSANSILGHFSVYFDPSFGWLCITDGSDDSWVEYPSAEDGFSSRDDAVGFVDGYYRAQVMKAFGLGIPRNPTGLQSVKATKPT